MRVSIELVSNSRDLVKVINFVQPLVSFVMCHIALNYRLKKSIASKYLPLFKDNMLTWTWIKRIGTRRIVRKMPKREMYG